MKPKILTTLPAYTRAAFLADALAGITVAMVALPLSIAIAIASGADPATGLVTAVVAGFLISALGGSRVQIGGPTGAFIVVVFAVIATHGYDGLVVATFMAGVILLIAAVLRAGSLIAHVPEAVINGFTIGIAIIIAASQLADALGLEVTGLPADFLPKLAALWAARGTLSVDALGVCLVTIVLIVALRRMFPRWPGLIAAVGLTSAAAALLGLDVDTIVSRFGALPDHLPVPALPDLSVARLVELLPSALVIAFLAGVESLLSAIVADRMIEDTHRPNAELMAQGAANIGSALFGGLPATGAIARTATNVRAGGATPVAGMVHALTVLAMMMVAAPLVGQLALPALAAVLIVTAWNMSEPHKWRQYWAEPFADRALLLLTLVLTVLADLTIAIGVGVALGLALRFARRKSPPADWRPPER
ncbi:SulP family inorganic anion transporter [Acuticoccus yangtzensis]|uniref:SulP family inorganic anion transporter n=1 Tax=Acuticoccus yangtzensis TaxID=1443441 RepID=UPI00094957E1|nr:SulP family inorganic anion transporter [Acuticoccus yangtzensis]